jgi:WS/DGAT/MGAT family acyltransferase
MSKREPMSSIDTAWLRMERSTNPMMIVAVMKLETRLPVERFREVIAARFLRHARFRDRAVLDGNSAYWERDSHFDLSFHVRRTALPRPAGKRELQELVSDLASTPLDPARPAWQYHLVDEYETGCAIIFRIHHCYGDGVALMRVLLSLADEADADAVPAEDAREESEDAGGGLLPQWLSPLANTVDQTVNLGTRLLGLYWDVVVHPTHAMDYARQGIDVAAEAARLALMPMDSHTRFKGKPLGVKRAAWTDRLPLDELKAVSHAAGCSINDVVLASIAGALRSYLIDRGDTVSDDMQLRALVPVNMRPPNSVDSLGNYFGLVAVLLPIGIENPLERLHEVKRRMLDLKASSQAAVTLGLLSAVGMGPKALQEQILDLLSSRASAVITNVAGPQQALYMGGARIAEIMFWVPQSGEIGVGISALSYDGAMQFGIIIDKHLAGDPENVASRFAAEFEQLLMLMLMGPWESDEPTT